MLVDVADCGVAVTRWVKNDASFFRLPKTLNAARGDGGID